jgi:cytochrome c553
MRRRVQKVPPALKPGDIDDVLEGPRLTRISFWGLGVSMLLALLIFVYWVNEPSRMTSASTTFAKDAIARGADYFAQPTNPKTGATNTRGVGCARCHGDDATGGTNTFLNSLTGQQQTVPAPNLTNVFRRYAEHPVVGYKTTRDFLLATIQRGRTNGQLGDGDDMPNWGQQFGGPLTDQQINDILDWLQTIQK